MNNEKLIIDNCKRKIFASLILILSIIHCPLFVNAQVRAVNDYGAIGLAQILKKLNTTKSVLMIGAHPDDEDSALLAYLARGENARTAYLSLTRGDGGQNIIGSELFESLGVIRTEELLQARRLDGAEQFFTRAFDFGFTKTLAETKSKWDEKVILCDAVNVIRNFRPLVVISRFAGTPADGHGQHQYSGYISPLAVKAAADPAQCQDSGTAWQVQKFYVEQGFRDNSQPTLKINTGEYNFLLGRSYAEIAAEGRSQHKTQEQGGLELKGSRFSGLNLIESVAPKSDKEKNIFDGIDTSLTNFPKIVGTPDYLRNDLVELQNTSDNLIKQNGTFDNKDNISVLAQMNNRIRSLRELQERIDYSFDPLALRSTNLLLREKEQESIETLKLAAGIQVDALTNRETVSPNEDFLTSVKVFYPLNSNIKIKEVKLNAPNNWQISNADEPKNNSPFASFSRETANDAKFFTVKVAANAKPTAPYFLEKPRDGDFYRWKNDDSQTEPFQKPFLTAQITAEIRGTEVTFNQPVEYRYADPIRGEIRREINVVPRISLDFEQNLLLVSQNRKPQTKKIILNVADNSSAVTNGIAKLIVPKNWRVEPALSNFDLPKKGVKTSLEFNVTIPADVKPDNYEIAARIESNNEVFNQTMHTIAYPHIQTHRFYTDANTKIDVLDLKTAPVKVGYIMGSGDEVPEAIGQMGLPVDLLSEKDLTAENLAKYDVIVAGIRAYQVRDDLIANNQKVLDYVRSGGTLIVQYQRPDYAANNLTPFPADMNDTQKTTAGTTARVVDENAKVKILDANSPVFNCPNKITDADFSGWVQERNLYNFVTFDKNYTPLLEAHDAGELENKGGMVYAKVGKGNYIYTSYSFFRQLPAGVPGAYRLFANLLSLPKAANAK